MSLTRVLRYAQPDELYAGAAGHLITHLAALQQHQDKVQLALTGGRAAHRIYESLAAMAPSAQLDPSKLELWWSSERFVPTTDPRRNATEALAVLARTFTLVPGQTHPMPPNEGSADPDEAAFAYATELGDTIFDVCLLGLGKDGHIGSLFPGHPGSLHQDVAGPLAIGVTNAPTPPDERVTLTLTAINRSKQVWVFASGAEKQDAITRIFQGDEMLPATHVQGRDKTLWFVDNAAASGLPSYRCEL